MFFIWMVKVIRVCFGFALLPFVIGDQTHVTFLTNEKKAQNKYIHTSPPTP